MKIGNPDRQARAALFDGASLKEICDDNGWTPRLDRLVPWARWRPPSLETRVFDTRFYIALAPYDLPPPVALEPADFPASHDLRVEYDSARGPGRDRRHDLRGAGRRW